MTAPNNDETTYVSAYQEALQDMKAALRWIENKVGFDGEVAVLVAAVVIAAVSYWAVNTYTN
jgi:hypothetical protein